MRASLLLLITLSSTGCSRPRCPVRPVPTPPAPIIVRPDPTPCLLPDLPQPVTLHSQAAGDRVSITAADVGELAAYLTGVRAWIAAAQGCIDTPQTGSK